MLEPFELTMPKANKIRIGPYIQDIALQVLMTLVSAKVLISLQNLILKQDA